MVPGQTLGGRYVLIRELGLGGMGMVFEAHDPVLERDVDRRTLVFVYEGDARGGTAKWRYVTTGLGNATHVEIVDDPEVQGVQPGEVVLTAGHQTLTDGARVRVVENVGTDEGRRP